MQDDAKVECRTPQAGKTRVTRVLASKYRAVRRAIGSALDAACPGGARFWDLPKRPAEKPSPQDRAPRGSIGGHVTAANLNIEVEGEIPGHPGAGPQHLLRK